MSLVNDHVRRQFAEINQILNERDMVQQVTAARSKLPYAPTSEHEAALESFKNRQAWRDYGKWESGSGDRAACDAQLNELKKYTSPTKSDYKSPEFKTTRYQPVYVPKSPQHPAEVSAPREFRQMRTSPKNVEQIRQRVDQLHTQLINFSNHVQLLSREEREIESMVAQIEQKQKRLNELEGLMAGLYEKQERLVNGLEDYATPPMSTTGATCDSGSTETNDRVERIERLLVHVLKTQERQEAAIESLSKKFDKPYQLSDDEQLSDHEEQVNDQMLATGLSFAKSAENQDFVLKLLGLLSLVDTDEKREKCLENIQNLLHNHYDDQDSYSDQSEGIVYPVITDVEAIDLETLDQDQN